MHPEPHCGRPQFPGCAVGKRPPAMAGEAETLSCFSSVSEPQLGHVGLSLELRTSTSTVFSQLKHWYS